MGLAWLALWLPAYAVHYPLWNFLNLCDLAVILTCLGLWYGSPLLLSSQALSSLVVDLAWTLDVVWRLSLGRHLLGGTEYMWEARWPVWLRLMSLFHVVWPLLLLWALRRTGYDRRGFALQSALAACVLVLARGAGPETNLDFAFRDPILHRALGPAPVHLTLMIGGLIGVVYAPTHRLLSRLYAAPSEL